MEYLTVYFKVTYFETRFLSSMSIIDQKAPNLTFFSKGILEVTCKCSAMLIEI